MWYFFCFVRCLWFVIKIMKILWWISTLISRIIILDFYQKIIKKTQIGLNLALIPWWNYTLNMYSNSWRHTLIRNERIIIRIKESSNEVMHDIWSISEIWMSSYCNTLYTLEKMERLQDKKGVSIMLDKSYSDNVMWTKTARAWAAEKVMDQSISLLVKSLL